MSQPPSYDSSTPPPSSNQPRTNPLLKSPAAEGEAVKNVTEVLDSEDEDKPARKRPRTSSPEKRIEGVDDDDIEFVDPRKKFLIKSRPNYGQIQTPCGDPRCPRLDCFVDDACRLYIYLPLMFHSEPLQWMVPVERRRGGRLKLDSLPHLLHVAGADRIVYMTWRIGQGWVHFNWNEWQVLPGEDVILRPKHEEIGENRPGMKEVMQRLYASMLNEGWTAERVPARFR